jgi:hypothetical protein
MFPNLVMEGSGYPSDKITNTVIEFYYIHNGRRYQMKWSRGRNWNKSFMGLRKGEQPERVIYLRTLANLTNPSEVRSILQINKKITMDKSITPDLLLFAERILPIKYKNIRLLSSKGRDILFAVQENDNSASYSEFHMSAGERAIIRLSKDISKINNALILIDEVEAGLHPYTQQLLMLELQRLALRNDLQIIVATHSPVILETVPPEARIFLERIKDNVTVQPAYRDIMQKAFYGQSIDKLSILCEDEIAEAIILGVLDVLNPKLNITPDDIIVGRNTGKNEFPQHIKTLSKFNQLDGFLFILDGDARNMESEIRKASEDRVTPIFLPGSESPEIWIWNTLKKYMHDYAEIIGISINDLEEIMRACDQIYDSATDKRTDIPKNKLQSLAEKLKRDVTNICRIVGRKESEKNRDIISNFIHDLELNIINWRSRKSSE